MDLHFPNIGIGGMLVGTRSSYVGACSAGDFSGDGIDGIAVGSPEAGTITIIPGDRDSEAIKRRSRSCTERGGGNTEAQSSGFDSPYTDPAA